MGTREFPASPKLSRRKRGGFATMGSRCSTRHDTDVHAKDASAPLCAVFPEKKALGNRNDARLNTDGGSTRVVRGDVALSQNAGERANLPNAVLTEPRAPLRHRDQLAEATPPTTDLSKWIVKLRRPEATAPKDAARMRLMRPNHPKS